MKTLILYSSKTGNTKEAAKYIAKSIKGATLVDFAEKQPSIKKYDLIIIGSGIYFGKINTKLKKYLREHIDDLLEKKFAIFFCCDKTTDKKIKSLIDKNFKGRLSENAIDIVCASKNNETSSSYYINKMSYWFGRKENQTAKEIEQSIDYDALDDFIELLSNTTIVEKGKQLRNNPVPPVKDIKTRKERISNKNTSKEKHKQIADQKQPATNKKIKTTKTAKEKGIDNTITTASTKASTKAKTNNAETTKSKSNNAPNTTKTASKNPNTNKANSKDNNKSNNKKNNAKTNKTTVSKTTSVKNNKATTNKTTATKSDKNTSANKTPNTKHNKQNNKTTTANTKTVNENNKPKKQSMELENTSKNTNTQNTNSNTNTTVSETKPMK